MKPNLLRKEGIGGFQGISLMLLGAGGVTEPSLSLSWPSPAGSCQRPQAAGSGAALDWDAWELLGLVAKGFLAPRLIPAAGTAPSSHRRPPSSSPERLRSLSRSHPGGARCP